MKNTHILPAQLPDANELANLMQRLRQLPGGVVMIAISTNDFQNWPDVRTAVLNAQDRAAIKRAITSARTKRTKAQASHE